MLKVSGCLLVLLSFTLAAGEIELPVEIVKLGAPDPAVRLESAKNVLAALKESTAEAKRPYIKALAAEFENADAAKRDAAVVKLASCFDTIRKVATQQQVDALKAIGTGTPEEKKKGQEYFVENIMNMLERDFAYAEIEKLASPEKSAAEAAQKTLLDLGADGAPYLASCLDDERPIVRRSCFEILKLLGPAAKTASNDLQFLLDSDEKSARRSAAMLLEALGPDAVEVVDDLVMYLSHDEKSVRRAATNILKKIGPAAKEQAGDLADLLEDEDKHIRSVAAEVLIAMGPSAVGAVETLTATLDDTNNDASAREFAATVLAAIGPAAKAALPVLKKHEKDPDPVVKTAVEAALKTVGKE